MIPNHGYDVAQCWWASAFSSSPFRFPLPFHQLATVVSNS
jgi:hypothetical protein